jgi:hypothetical protein
MGQTRVACVDGRTSPQASTAGHVERNGCGVKRDEVEEVRWRGGRRVFIGHAMCDQS